MLEGHWLHGRNTKEPFDKDLHCPDFCRPRMTKSYSIMLLNVDVKEN